MPEQEKPRGASLKGEEPGPTPPPRTVVTPAMRAIGLAVYAFMLFGGLVVLAFGLARGFNALRLTVSPTIAIQGTIIDRSVDQEQTSGRSGPSSVDRYDLTYSFRPSDSLTDVVGITAVSQDEWNRTQVGVATEIIYLVGDPSTNWILGNSPIFGEATAGAFGVAIGTFVLLVTQWRFAPPSLRFGRLVGRVRPA